MSMPPCRQSIPPVLVFGLCLWASTGVILLACSSLSIRACYALAAVALAASAVLGIVYLRKPTWMLLVAALGLLCGVILAGSFGGHVHALRANVPQEGQVSVRALEDAIDYGYGPTFAAEVVSGPLAQSEAQVYLPQGAPLPFYGEVVSGQGSWSEFPASFDSRSWEQGQLAKLRFREFASRDTTGPFSAIVEFRIRCIGMLQQRADERFQSGAVLLQALLCGYRSSLTNTDLYENFKVTGIVHLVAVSGAHLTLVALAVGVALRALRIGKRTSLAVQILLIVSYLVFTACSPSSIRAAVMAFAALCSFFTQRRGAPLAAIGLSIVLFILFNPTNALSASFLLSALSTLSIVLFAPLIHWWLGRLASPLPPFVLEALSMTIASSVLTMPYSSALFSQVSLIGLLANVVVAPLFAPLCLVGAGSLAVANLFPVLSGYAISSAAFLGSCFCFLVELLATVPFASIPVSGSVAASLLASLAAAALLWWKWPVTFSKGNACIVGILLAVLFCSQVSLPGAEGNRIVMLNVGQGDAILLQSNGGSVLVDTGTNDALLKQSLARTAAYRLDAVFITHGDDDHMGSLRALSKVCEVDAIGLSAPTFSCACDACTSLLALSKEVVGAERLIGLGVGDVVDLGDFRLEVLWPCEFADQGGNADSLCFLVSLRENDSESKPVALLLGDAESEQLNAMVERYGLSNIPIVKVGHHGSKASLTPELVQVLNPRIALIGVGENNRYGHPSAECLSALQDAGVAVYRTDLQENISCTFREEGEVEVRVG